MKRRKWLAMSTGIAATALAGCVDEIEDQLGDDNDPTTNDNANNGQDDETDDLDEDDSGVITAEVTDLFEPDAEVLRGVDNELRVIVEVSNDTDTHFFAVPIELEGETGSGGFELSYPYHHIYEYNLAPGETLEYRATIDRDEDMNRIEEVEANVREDFLLPTPEVGAPLPASDVIAEPVEIDEDAFGPQEAVILNIPLDDVAIEGEIVETELELRRGASDGNLDTIVTEDSIRVPAVGMPWGHTHTVNLASTEDETSIDFTATPPDLDVEVENIEIEDDDGLRIRETVLTLTATGPMHAPDPRIAWVADDSELTGELWANVLNEYFAGLESSVAQARQRGERDDIDSHFIYGEQFDNGERFDPRTYAIEQSIGESRIGKSETLTIDPRTSLNLPLPDETNTTIAVFSGWSLAGYTEVDIEEFI